MTDYRTLTSIASFGNTVCLGTDHGLSRDWGGDGCALSPDLDTSITPVGAECYVPSPGGNGSGPGFDCRTDPDDHVSAPSFPCGTIEKTCQSVRSINMSFVGIVLSDDAVYGFGDSKSTVIVNNAPQEDTKRGPVQKVFSSKEFVVATYAANSFFDRFGMPVLMEEWMEENTRRCRTPKEMLIAFQDGICENISSNTMQYGFIFGGFDRNGPYAQVCMVSNKILTVNPKIRHKAGEPFIVTCGDGYYTNYTNSIETALLINSLKGCEDSDISSTLKEHVEKTIAGADRLGGYNPAGPPVNVVTLKP